MSHSWPGNIRELRNVVTKAAVMAQDVAILPEDLPLTPGVQSFEGSNGHTVIEMPPVNGPISAKTNGSGFEGRGASLEGMERRMILEALKATGGHQQKAAARLGISRRTLSRKLKLYESERAEAVQ